MNTKLKAKLLLGTFLTSGLLAQMSNASIIHAGSDSSSSSSYSSDSESDSSSDSELSTQGLSPNLDGHRLTRSNATIMDRAGNTITSSEITDSSANLRKDITAARTSVRGATASDHNAIQDTAPTPVLPEDTANDAHRLVRMDAAGPEEFAAFMHADHYHSDGEFEAISSSRRKRARLDTNAPDSSVPTDESRRVDPIREGYRLTQDNPTERKEYAQRVFDEIMQSNILSGHEEEIEKAISEGALVNRIYANDQTPLHIAVLSGNIKVIRAIINVHFNPHARRANPNVNISPNLGARDKDGYTPLHLAAIHQTANVMKALLVPNCVTYIDNKDSQGRTAYRIAKEMGKEDVAELLKNACANTKI